MNREGALLLLLCGCPRGGVEVVRVVPCYLPAPPLLLRLLRRCAITPESRAATAAAPRKGLLRRRRPRCGEPAPQPITIGSAAAAAAATAAPGEEGGGEGRGGLEFEAFGLEALEGALGPAQLQLQCNAAPPLQDAAADDAASWMTNESDRSNRIESMGKSWSKCK